MKVNNVYLAFSQISLNFAASAELLALLQGLEHPQRWTMGTSVSVKIN